MKKLIAFALLVLTLIFAVPSNADSIRAPKGYAGKLWDETLALYGTSDDVTHFVCTATPIQKIDGGYVLLTAGHCVQTVSKDVQFSVAEEVGGARQPVALIKAYFGEDIDFAIFNLKTTKNYPVATLGPNDKLTVGDKIFSPNFALGLGKQLSIGTISTRNMSQSEQCSEVDCVGAFIVQEYAGGGASGAAVISAKTHHVIGLLQAEFENGNVGFQIEPISRFAKFMAGPNQPHPREDVQVDPSVDPLAPTGIVIPESDFQTQYGPEHPFLMTVHGIDPTFIQGGYTFQVATDRIELPDEFYNAPVFIREDKVGLYSLVSIESLVWEPLDVLSKVPPSN